jgi:hypothetical protein
VGICRARFALVCSRVDGLMMARSPSAQTGPTERDKRSSCMCLGEGAPMGGCRVYRKATPL